MAADGTLFFSGERAQGDSYPYTLWQDDGHGCGFSRVPGFEKTWVRDIEADPRDERVLFGVTAGFMRGTQNGLMRRDADGIGSASDRRKTRSASKSLRLMKTAKGLCACTPLH